MPIRLSYSTLELLHSCERKYQLEKLLAGSARRDSEHFSFGHSFGAGVASYLVDQDKDKAIFAAWLAYWPVIETDKKNQVRCLVALMASFSRLDTLLKEYELVSFQGKPACELSFRLNIDADYYFVGYVDAVLRHRRTGVYVVFEVKHTGFNLLDLSPAYRHSGQALGYSIALDKIVGKELSSYGVLYFVAQLGKDLLSPTKLHVLPFNKTLLDRLNWFITLGLDVKHLHEMQELGIYPKRGGSCVSFNRACPHFGVCHLHALDTPKVEEPDTVDYQFEYDMEELVAEHLARIQKGVQPEVGSIESTWEVVTASNSGAAGMVDVDDLEELPPEEETEAEELDISKLLCQF